MEMRENNLKIILCGNEGVGKTCLIHNLIHHRFVDGFHSTIAANVQDWSTSVNGETINFKIWDTAGQERYKSLAPVYFREAAACMIVYDANQADGFESVQSWADMFRNVAGSEAYIIVAANKCDMIQDFEKANETRNRIKEELGLPTVNVSAKTGENVVHSFHMIADEIAHLSSETHFKNAYDDQSDLSQNCC